MAYSYGTQGAPAVGGGAPGLPSRSSSIGTIIAATAAPSSDYLLCNGLKYKTSDYPNLAPILAKASTLEFGTPSIINNSSGLTASPQHCVMSRKTNRINLFFTDGVNGSQARCTTDFGVTWSTVTVSASVQFAATEVVCSETGTWVALVSGIGIRRSLNDGASWATPYSTATALVTVATDHKGTWVAAGNNGLGIRSTDDGATWSAISIGLSTSQISCAATNGSGIWIAGTSSASSISTDNGATWSTYNALPLTTCKLEYVNGYFLATSYAGNQYAAYASYDDGGSWTVITPAITGSNMVGLALLSRGRGLLAGATSGGATNINLPYMSLDGGYTVVSKLPVYNTSVAAGVCGIGLDGNLYMFLKDSTNSHLMMAKPVTLSLSDRFSVPALSSQTGELQYYIKAR